MGINASFIKACEGGDEDAVHAALNHTLWCCRADPHHDFGRGFIEACARGHTGVVRHILRLEGPRDVMKSHRMFSMGPFYKGYTAACREGQLNVVRQLTAHYRDKQGRQDGCYSWGFAVACDAGQLHVVRELLALRGDESVDVHGDSPECPFVSACVGGHLAVVRELLALTGDRRIDVHAHNAFAWTCQAGQVHVMRELLALTGDRYIDVHAGNERAFRMACTAEGRDAGTHAVQELLALTGDRRIDVHARNDHAWHLANAGGRDDVARVLLALTGDRRIPAHAVRTLYSYDSVLREVLRLRDDRALPYEWQEQQLDHNRAAVMPWTRSLTAWRASGVHLGTLHPVIRRATRPKAERLVWRARRVVCAARRAQ
uniref:Ankyrin repeat protein n=1 Tax=viral metagenome TaxID=1070528 RepID=A0A6C0AUN4_9ZZZZ